jgi:hypothetical protein
MIDLSNSALMQIRICRELSREGIHEFVNKKTVYIKN